MFHDLSITAKSNPNLTTKPLIKDSKVTTLGVKAIVWLFNKTMREQMHGLHVDHTSVERVKSLLEQDIKVVLLPLYKA
jgi:hypothetical protein